jgi:arginase family enzyme
MRVAVTQTAASDPVYVSLDIDAADPAYAPGAGPPTVGDFTSREIIVLVRGLRGLDLVGFDVFEVSPPCDISQITAVLACNLIFEFCSVLVRSKPRSELPLVGSNKELW